MSDEQKNNQFYLNLVRYYIDNRNSSWTIETLPGTELVLYNGGIFYKSQCIVLHPKESNTFWIDIDSLSIQHSNVAEFRTAFVHYFNSLGTDTKFKCRTAKKNWYEILKNQAVKERLNWDICSQHQYTKMVEELVYSAIQEHKNGIKESAADLNYSDTEIHHLLSDSDFEETLLPLIDSALTYTWTQHSVLWWSNADPDDEDTFSLLDSRTYPVNWSTAISRAANACLLIDCRETFNSLSLDEFLSIVGLDEGDFLLLDDSWPEPDDADDGPVEEMD